MFDEISSTLDILLGNEIVNRNSYIACGMREAKSMPLEYYPIYDESIEQLNPLYLAMVLDPRFKNLLAFHHAEFSQNKINLSKSYFIMFAPSICATLVITEIKTR